MIIFLIGCLTTSNFNFVGFFLSITTTVRKQLLNDYFLNDSLFNSFNIIHLNFFVAWVGLHISAFILIYTDEGKLIN